MRDLIYSVDKWTSYLFGRLVKESPVVQQHIDVGTKKVPTFKAFAREVFARLYGTPPPVSRIRPEDGWAETLHSALEELDAYKKLRAYSAHDKELASAATATLLEQLVDMLPEPPSPIADPDKRRDEVRGLLDFLKQTAPDDADTLAALDKAIADGRASGAQAVASMVQFGNALDKDAIRGALRASVDAAATDSEEYTAAFAGLAGLGSTTAQLGDDTRAALGSALKSSDAMKRLALLAGRMRRLAMNKRRSRTKAAASEVNNITVGNDLSRLLPHELLKLSDPVLSLDFMRAFLEKSLFQYELVGNEKEGRGPVVVLIDDSVSMDGPPSTFAKATALALADLALSDRRTCRLIRFSDRLRASIDLRPGRDDTAKLLPFLADDVSGGTDFELPLTAAREAIDNDPVCERADVVLITDGEAELSKNFLDNWHAAARKDGLSTYAVHIGGQVPPVLHALTPDVIPLHSLVPERLEETLFGPIAGP